MIKTDASSIAPAPYYPDSHIIKRCNFDCTIVFPQIHILDRTLSPHLSYLTTLHLRSCCIQLYHIRIVLCEDHVVGIILFIAHNVCKQTVVMRFWLQHIPPYTHIIEEMRFWLHPFPSTLFFLSAASALVSFLFVVAGGKPGTSMLP